MRRTLKGTYTVERTLVTFSTWFDSFLPKSNGIVFVASKGAASTLHFYPWRVYDADEEAFVRVPSVREDGMPTDTVKVIAPITPPRVTRDHDGFHVTLPKPMEAALLKRDPAFRMWIEADARELDRGPGPGHNVRGATAIVGDFDGDLQPDVAVVGKSGADQVVIAILSNSGNIRAVDVAWRKLPPGPRERRSRGDPRSVRPIHLELSPHGSFNPFCWVQRWSANPLDAVGIVEPGVARFDYALLEGRFKLFAPLP